MMGKVGVEAQSKVGALIWFNQFKDADTDYLIGDPAGPGLT